MTLDIPEEQEPTETPQEYYTAALSKPKNENLAAGAEGDVEIVDVSPEDEEEEEYTSQVGRSNTSSATHYEPSRPEAPKANTPMPQSESQEKKGTATQRIPNSCSILSTA